MRVFVAGGSGAVGSRIVGLLVEAGRDVVAMTSSEARAGALRAAGAEPAVCDALDPGALRETVAAAAPEVVVHALTRIPANVAPRRMPRDFELNDRLRTEGTRNLVEAARAAGARRVVAHASAFAYRHDGAGPRREDDPLWIDAPAHFRRTARALAELERLVTGTDGLEGVVLRNGHFYGPRTHVAPDGGLVAAIRAGRFPIVGDGGGVFSFAHVDDVAAATMRAVEGGPPGTYNVVDDEPAAVREWAPCVAELVGGPQPRRVPRLLARAVAGEWGLRFMTTQPGASNERARLELGWEPRWPSWREGFRALLG